MKLESINGRLAAALFMAAALAVFSAAGCTDTADTGAAPGQPAAAPAADADKEAVKADTAATPGRTLAAFSDPQRAALQLRGKYLVNAVGACGSCHGSASAGIFGPGAVLSGGRLMTDQFSQVRAANITPDKASGIGSWTVEEIGSAIRSSIGKDGRPLSLDLHAGYRWLAEADTDAIAVYLLSLAPVKNQVERREVGYFDRNKYGLMTRYIPVSGFVPRPKAGANTANGRYLASSLSRCLVCHAGSSGQPPQAVAAGGEPEVSTGISAGGAKLLSYLGSLLTAPTSDTTDIDPESAKLLSPQARKTIDSAVQDRSRDPDLDIRARAIIDGIYPIGGPDIRGGAGKPLEGWEADDIVRYLRSGRNLKGQSRDGRFCPWPFFSGLSDEDARAIALYLKRLN